MEHILWVEKYRPKKIEDCILPDDVKKTFQEYVKKGEIPNLLLSGTAGVGKTTVAKAMCEEIGLDVMVINASDERGIDVFRNQVKTFAASMSFGGGRKVIILDEADQLTSASQAAMRGAIEEFAINCSFIMTCNFKSKIMDAIQSRCSSIEFKIKNSDKPKIALAFLKRLEDILTKENVPYEKKVLAEIVQKYFPDFRRTLNELQRYSLNGSIDVGLLSRISDVSISDLMKSLKTKDFQQARKWIVQNIDADSSKIFRLIYDQLSTVMKPESIPNAIVILADYQNKAAFVGDQEINLAACFIELMGNCSFNE